MLAEVKAEAEGGGVVVGFCAVEGATGVVVVGFRAVEGATGECLLKASDRLVDGKAYEGTG